MRGILSIQDLHDVNNKASMTSLIVFGGGAPKKFAKNTDIVMHRKHKCRINIRAWGKKLQMFFKKNLFNVTFMVGENKVRGT